MATAQAQPEAARNLPDRRHSRNGRTISKLPAREKVERDNRIIELRLRGLSWPKIAKEVGAAERTCSHAFAEWAKGNLIKDSIPNPLNWLLEELAKLDAKHEQLAEIAYDADEASVKLAAVGRQLDVMKRSHELRTAARLLPPDLGVIPIVLEQRRTLKIISDVLERYEVPTEALDELLALLPDE